jgi:endonuclease/exonuclease/phosphatase family protein
MNRRLLRVAALAAFAAVLTGASAAPAAQSGNGEPGLAAVRFATFNASLNRNNAGDLRADLLASTDLSRPGVVQAHNVAEIIQRVAPDVVLINEFDFDPMALDLFADRFLAVPHRDAAGIQYPHRFIASSNTGIPSGFNLDNIGGVGGPNDAFGFGFFPGQFGMAVYSRYPIDRSRIRTFQRFRWKDMPGARLPDDPRTPAPADWYSPEELNVFRLSSKSHWDVPIQIGRKTVHFLVSHPTPPVFDDPPTFPAGVDFNGRRNADEIRFWADYISPGQRSAYIYDDVGGRGGLKPGSLFVIAGDQNSDPLDGDSIPGSIQQLLNHPLVNTELTPWSPGGPDAADRQGGANATHRSNSLYDTADFADGAPGNLRADYVLPRVNMDMRDARVFWPLPTHADYRLTGDFIFENRLLPGQGFPASDHRAVSIDVAIPGYQGGDD